MAPEYSGVQKISLAGIVIGSIMCVVGGLSPYWIESDPQNFGVFGQVVSALVEGHMGLFMYCLEVLGQKDCALFSTGKDDDNDGVVDNVVSGWLNVQRITCIACMLLAIVAGFTALCLACCTCCQRLICLGILSILSAGCGVGCAVTFYQDTELFTSSFVGFQLSSYGWAFYVFCVGVGILALCSFPACFASPNNSVGTGVVVSQPTAPPGTVMVNMDSTNYVNPHWQGQGQVMPQGQAAPWQGQGYAMGQGQAAPLPGQPSINTPTKPGAF